MDNNDPSTPAVVHFETQFYYATEENSLRCSHVKTYLTKGPGKTHLLKQLVDGEIRASFLSLC